MRSSKNRSRSKGNRNRSVGNIVNRVFDSSGPEGKVRGTPQQIIEKYNQLSRDATLGNDRVASENFRQHSEHYARMLGEAQREQDARREAQEAQAQQQQQQQREQRQPREAEPRQAEQGAENAAQPQPDEAGNKPFDAVIDNSGGNEEGGLVETPESAPKPRRSRSRAPRRSAEAAPEGAAPAAASDGQEAAE